MPRYYFHLTGPDSLHDDIGEEMEGIAAVLQVARRTAAELIAEEIVKGQIVDLAQAITVAGDQGNVLVLKYSDLFVQPRR